jgi:hypothetical protein
MTARPVFSRRRFLAGASLVALASAGRLPQPAFAQIGDELDVFLALSEDVTGHAGLDPVLAEAILAAFKTVGVERDLAAIAPERDSHQSAALGVDEEEFRRHRSRIAIHAAEMPLCFCLFPDPSMGSGPRGPLGTEHPPPTAATLNITQIGEQKRK